MNKKWKHSDPYPTNPFERVSGKELVKLHHLNKLAEQNKRREQLPEAPF